MHKKHKTKSVLPKVVRKPLDEKEIATPLPSEGTKMEHEFRLAATNGKNDELKSIMCDGHQIDINAGDKSNRTAVYLAAQEGHPETVQLLIDLGADIEKTESRNGRTPLCIASLNGHLEVVRTLVEAGANIEKKDCGIMKWNALHWASHSGHLNIVQYLVSCGADLHTRDHNGRTLLHGLQHPTVADYLIEQGVTMRGDNIGDTPLHAIARLGDSEMASFLLKRGTRPGTPITAARNQAGLLPVELSHNEAVRKTILEFMTDANEVGDKDQQ